MLDELRLNNTAFLITDLESGETLESHRPDERFRSASLIKVFILCAALAQTDVSGEVPCRVVMEGSELSELGLAVSSIDRLLYMMTGSSDNGATNVLIDLLGFERINGYISDIMGLKDTVLARKMLDYGAIAAGKDNYTTASDMMAGIKEVFRLGGAKYLAGAKCLDRLMRYVYHGCRFYGKAGDMHGAVHDVGVFAPCGDDTGTTGVFAAFLSEDFERAVPACGVVGLRAYEIMCARRKDSGSGGLRILEHGKEDHVRPAGR